MTTSAHKRDTTTACGRFPSCHKYRAQSPAWTTDNREPARRIALYNRLTSLHGERITAVHLVTVIPTTFDDDACVHADIGITIERLPVTL